MALLEWGKAATCWSPRLTCRTLAGDGQRGGGEGSVTSLDLWQGLRRPVIFPEGNASNGEADSHPYFTDEGTEAQRGYVTRPMSHSAWQEAEMGAKQERLQESLTR